MLARFRAAMPRPAIVLAAAGAGAAVIVAIAATALWGAKTSAHAVKPLGSIGHDGWIRGPGYEIRIHPEWFELTRTANSDQVVIVYTIPGSAIEISREPVNTAVASFRDFPLQYELHRVSTRPAVIGGTRGLSVAGTRADGSVYEAWLVSHDSVGYIAAFITPRRQSLRRPKLTLPRCSAPGAGARPAD